MARNRDPGFLTVKGQLARVTFDGDVVTVIKGTFSKSDNRIPLARIESIGWKAPTWVTNGFIRFLLFGAPPVKKADSVYKAVDDVNAVIVTSGQEKNFLWLRNILEVAMAVQRDERPRLSPDQYQDGVEWFKAAAEAGNTNAIATYAKICFQSGQGQQAMKHYEKAAKKGNVDGMFGLAVLLHEQGKVVDAKEWYIAAAKANHPGATANLGLLLYAEGDVQGAKDLYMSAIGTGGEGSQNAMCNLGQLLYDTGDKVGAMVWYRRAAEAGQQTAMLNLSQMLAESGNLEEAAEWRALSGE